MLTLPDAILPVLHPFATLFRTPTWLKAQILLAGAILAPGQRTVAAARRVRGRSDHLDYARYHEVLNRAVWSPRQAARILLMLLLQHLDQGDGPLVFGIDETLERRRGSKIKSLGIYRDAVRSSRSHLVKASGLRWVSLMWLGHVPWAGRYWALPFLTVLAPSERCYRQRGRRHKKLTAWARQMIVQLRRRPRTPPDLAGRQAEDRSLGIGHHPRGADCQQVPHGVGAQVEDRSRPLLVAFRLPDVEPPAAVGQQLHVAPAECRSSPSRRVEASAMSTRPRLPATPAVSMRPARPWLTPPMAVRSSNPAFRCTAPTEERCSRRVATLSRCVSASSVR